MSDHSNQLSAGSEAEHTAMTAAVRLIGDQWSLLILWCALHGTARFQDFRNELGIARNILSHRLSRLVDEGILEKVPVHAKSLRLKYRPTENGEALRSALEMIEAWGRRESTTVLPRD